MFEGWVSNKDLNSTDLAEWFLAATRTSCAGLKVARLSQSQSALPGELAWRPSELQAKNIQGCWVVTGHKMSVRGLFLSIEGRQSETLLASVCPCGESRPVSCALTFSSPIRFWKWLLSIFFPPKMHIYKFWGWCPSREILLQILVSVFYFIWEKGM